MIECKNKEEAEKEFETGDKCDKCSASQYKDGTYSCQLLNNSNKGKE